MSEALEVLKKFSGVWETRTRIRHEGPPRREFITRGKATCRQTLEGRYFEFRSQSIPAGQADLQLMTYDVQAGPSGGTVGLGQLNPSMEGEDR